MKRHAAVAAIPGAFVRSPRPDGETVIKPGDRRRNAENDVTSPTHGSTTRAAPPGPPPHDRGRDDLPDIDVVARCRVIRPIARGGMGVVYLASDPELLRSVAVKILPREFADNERAVERLRCEAELLSSVKHDNVARIHSVVKDSEHGLCIVMEYVNGRTLDELINAERVSAPRAARIVGDIARALRAIHALDLIHRDLKPHNVIVGDQDLVKVLDFGLARPVAGDPNAPRAGVAGTYGYMAPEQCRAQPVSAATDVFALGCILWECLAHKRAFPANSAADYERRLSEGPEHRDVHDADPELSELALACLELDAARRPTLDDVIRRLEAKAPVESLAPESITPNNLPNFTTSIIHRPDDESRLAVELRNGRLLTLTGSGGCGKTRLAVELARNTLDAFPDGAWFIELEAIRDPDHVCRAVADELPFIDDPHADPDPDALARRIGERRLLLILDNCEHLQEACARLAARVIRRTPNATILAASRERLNIPDERAERIPSLAIPDDPERIRFGDARRYPAIELFDARAHAACNNFTLDESVLPDVAWICWRLDGIPLAIELAAALVASMPVRTVADRLRDCINLESHDPTASTRRLTLMAMIDASAERLTDPERRLLPRLAVFDGGWTHEAATDVCADDDLPQHDVAAALHRLVNRSLVVYDPARRGGWFRLLQTVREWADERLPDAERAPLLDRRLAYYADRAEHAAEGLRSDAQSDWLDAVDAEIENMTAALDHAEACDPEAALTLATALHRYWYIRGPAPDGLRRLERTLERIGAPANDEQRRRRADAANAAGILAWQTSDLRRAHERLADALADYEILGADERRAAVLSNLGLVLIDDHRLDDAMSRQTEALRLYEELGDDRGAANARLNLGMSHLRLERHEEAADLFRACLAEFAGRDALRETTTRINMGEALRKGGASDEAEEVLHSAISLAIGMRYTEGVALAMVGLALTYNQAERHAEAAACVGLAEHWYGESDRPPRDPERDELNEVRRCCRESLGDHRYDNILSGDLPLADPLTADAMRTRISRSVNIL